MISTFQESTFILQTFKRFLFIFYQTIIERRNEHIYFIYTIISIIKSVTFIFYLKRVF